MPEPSLFRHYQIVQDADGNNVELVRNAEQVAVLAFDTLRMEYVHCHVLLEPLASRTAFDDTTRTLQKHGHPAMARLIESGEDEGNPFYITSSVDGETLRTYLARQQDLPGWLAIMIATRALETAVAVCERGDFLTDAPLESLRLVQTAPQAVQVLAADFRMVDAGAGRSRALQAGFEKQARLLRSFLVEQGGTLPDHVLPAADYAELLGSCLASAGVGVIAAMRELRTILQKLAPGTLSGEIPAPLKPRALLAPLLAGYQEVARGLVNLVRIQSQRLDMANPYSMRGTLTRTGRAVLIEQVPPARIAHARVKEADEAALKAGKQRGNSGLIPLALVNESDDITCLAEELAEGVSLADLIRERHCLDVQEAYLVLAGLDTALTQLDSAALPVSKLRLDDIFLLTGFAREDTRTTKLLVSKLNEWPAFNIMVRAHPTLASMAGRGTDPAVLLPPPPRTPAGTVWHAGWLAALARFLLGFEPPPGTAQDSAAGGARERETILRLLDDEMARGGESRPAKRSDFLARYARIIQHYDRAKPQASPAPARALGTEAALSLGLKPAPKIVPVTTPAPRREPVPLSSTEPLRTPVALTTGGAARGEEEPSIGFAELLFRNGGAEPSPPDAPDWARAAVSAPPTLPEHLIPRENVPIWLKAAVFLSGSMVLGAMCAHLSGSALWQKKKPAAPVEAAQPHKAPAAVQSRNATAPAKSGKTTAVPAPPKAGVAEVPIPKAIPVTAPPESVPPSGAGVTLSLPPGATGLRDQLAPAAASPAPPRP